MSRPRWRLVISYDGTEFRGWQHQPGQRTVQRALEDALESLLGGERRWVDGSGRTDAGVHALGQVGTFKCHASRTARELLDGLNALLPEDLAVRHVARAQPSFHARFSAVGKRYRYRVRTEAARTALDRHRTWDLRRRLDYPAMEDALSRLVGEHDFRCFQASGCTARNTVRRIFEARLERSDDGVVVELHGTGFLRHMVRNIVGTVVEVGLGKEEPSWLDQVLETRDRRAAGRTAPPQGLYLVNVDYPASTLEPYGRDKGPGTVEAGGRPGAEWMPCPVPDGERPVQAYDDSGDPDDAPGAGEE